MDRADGAAGGLGGAGFFGAGVTADALLDILRLRQARLAAQACGTAFSSLPGTGLDLRR